MIIRILLFWRIVWRRWSVVWCVSLVLGKCSVMRLCRLVLMVCVGALRLVFWWLIIVVILLVLVLCVMRLSSVCRMSVLVRLSGVIVSRLRIC